MAKREGSEPPANLKALAERVEAAAPTALVELIQARLLGLGNIRTKESVDELIQIMRSVARPRVDAHRRDERPVLAAVPAGTQQRRKQRHAGRTGRRMHICHVVTRR